MRRFFTESDGAYRVVKSIRDMCVFAHHNALADPPFSQIDFISCRNLLIYLGGDLQQRLIPTMHYALKPGGVLWLGSSETIGAFRDHFDARDSKFRIYAKKGTPARLATPIPLGIPGRATRPESARRGERDPLAAAGDAQRKADRILLNRYSPPGVLINADLDILQFRGDTTRYLSPTPGKASLNLMKMLREGLVAAVRSGITKARKSGSPVRGAGHKVRTVDGTVTIAVEVIPVRGNVSREDCFLILFDDSSAALAENAPALPVRHRRQKDDAAPRARTAAALRQELETTRDQLQAVIEQQEAANEELQSANEEVQSSNEELQSMNEELETSKEEIQSSNEELATVNDELQTRNAELTESNDDMVNLLSSVQMAIVMLGPDLRIRWFTPMAERLLNLGIGIPAELQPRIFDLFVQGDAGPGRKQHGLGIGLTLARSLVEMHGGTLELSSDGTDAGAEFVVTLPLVQRT